MMSFWKKLTLVPWSQSRRKVTCCCMDFPARKSNGEILVGAQWRSDWWKMVSPAFKDRDTKSSRESLAVTEANRGALSWKVNEKVHHLRRETVSRRCLRWTVSNRPRKAPGERKRKSWHLGSCPRGHITKLHYQSSKILLTHHWSYREQREQKQNNGRVVKRRPRWTKSEQTKFSFPFCRSGMFMCLFWTGKRKKL